MKRIITLTALLFSMLLPAGCISGDEDEARVENHVRQGDEIPSFNDMEGFLNGAPAAELSSDDFSGKSGMIFFFASYCPDCRSAMGKIEAVWQQLKDDENIVIAPISRQSNGETPETVREYWDEKGYTMPYYLDTDRQLYDKFANITIPRLYIIDAGRKVTRMFVGTIPDDPQEIIALLR